MSETKQKEHFLKKANVGQKFRLTEEDTVTVHVKNTTKEILLTRGSTMEVLGGDHYADLMNVNLFNSFGDIIEEGRAYGKTKLQINTVDPDKWGSVLFR